MIVINNVAYKDTYKKIKFGSENENYTDCFICRKKFIRGDKYFWEESIYVKKSHKDKDGLLNYYPICFDCVKTPVKAEKIILPLLKIMYGGKIKISRINKKTNETKVFYY